ncbi:hypothetical protein ACOJUR_12085 [Alicyclobacillus tolerans]|uniref:hypothetical protein n=1 Tax=Alicyclobacillus tolerans TaxID=90970 RepID=UPI003B78D9DA
MDKMTWKLKTTIILGSFLGAIIVFVGGDYIGYQSGYASSNNKINNYIDEENKKMDILAKQLNIENKMADKLETALSSRIESSSQNTNSSQNANESTSNRNSSDLTKSVDSRGLPSSDVEIEGNSIFIIPKDGTFTMNELPSAIQMSLNTVAEDTPSPIYGESSNNTNSIPLYQSAEFNFGYTNFEGSNYIPGFFELHKSNNDYYLTWYLTMQQGGQMAQNSSGRFAVGNKIVLTYLIHPNGNHLYPVSRDAMDLFYMQNFSSLG